MLFPMLYVLYLYISTFLRMCAVPNMAVFCTSLYYDYYYYIFDVPRCVPTSWTTCRVSNRRWWWNTRSLQRDTLTHSSHARDTNPVTCKWVEGPQITLLSGNTMPITRPCIGHNEWNVMCDTLRCSCVANRPPNEGHSVNTAWHDVSRTTAIVQRALRSADCKAPVHQRTAHIIRSAHKQPDLNMFWKPDDLQLIFRRLLSAVRTVF